MIFATVSHSVLAVDALIAVRAERDEVVNYAEDHRDHPASGRATTFRS